MGFCEQNTIFLFVSQNKGSKTKPPNNSNISNSNNNYNNDNTYVTWKHTNSIAKKS